MKHYKINAGIYDSHLYTFINSHEDGTEDFIEDVLKEILFFSDTGYAGFRQKSALRKHLLWGIGRGRIPPFGKNDEKRIVRIITAALKKCQKAVPLSDIKIFIFPTNSRFVKENLSGSSGFCVWKNVITIFVHPKSKWQKSLANTICHEYAHAATSGYHKNKTLLEAMIDEGIAEDFCESVLSGKPSPWSKALTEKEARTFFRRMKNKLNSKNPNLRQEVLYGSVRYPMWTGYSIGYYIVKNYTRRKGKVIWKKMFLENPEKILMESGF
ncbi:MAG: hypothetical protein HYW26_00130 [Candidatus Aenigmarchaeota archaeon]|nr:hypothetical protein [Candidatus Aenigmarchaeota archaeon]